ncbi:hypothetical protein AB5I41_31435 [Sphingomonas sp. MMS24-JH45]
MGKARTIAANERRDPNKMGFDLNDQGDVALTSVPSMQTIDYAKRGMDDAPERYRNDKPSGAIGCGPRSEPRQKSVPARGGPPRAAVWGCSQSISGADELMDALTRGQDFYGTNVSP